QKAAHVIAERLVGGSTEDLESVVDPGALRLALRLLVRRRLFFRGSFFGGRRRNCGHSFSSQFPVLSSQFWAPVSRLRTENRELRPVFLAGPLGFEPRQSAPKALDLPLVDGPVKPSADCTSIVVQSLSYNNRKSTIKKLFPIILARQRTCRHRLQPLLPQTASCLRGIGR